MSVRGITTHSGFYLSGTPSGWKPSCGSVILLNGLLTTWNSDAQPFRIGYLRLVTLDRNNTSVRATYSGFADAQTLLGFLAG
jgi:hypothetical protein